MKKILISVLMLCIAFLTSGCQSQRYHIIPFENKNAELECIVNSKFNVKIKKDDNTLSLTVNEPMEIAGAMFVFSDTDSYALSGETKIPIDKSAYSGIYALVSILNIKEEMSISASSNDHGASVIFIKDGCNYSFGYDSGGYLVSVDIKSPDFTYSIIINGLKIQ